MEKQENRNTQEYKAVRQPLTDDELEYAAGGCSAVNTIEIESLLGPSETADNAVKRPGRFLK